MKSWFILLLLRSHLRSMRRGLAHRGLRLRRDGRDNDGRGDRGDWNGNLVGVQEGSGGDGCALDGNQRGNDSGWHDQGCGSVREAT